MYKRTCPESDTILISILGFLFLGFIIIINLFLQAGEENSSSFYQLHFDVDNDAPELSFIPYCFSVALFSFNGILSFQSSFQKSGDGEDR